MEGEMPLADIIRMLREELLELYRERKETNQAPLWRIADCEIELNIVSRETKQIDGKVSVAVFATSGSGNYTHEQIHKIRLKLTPVLADGNSHDRYDIPTFLRKSMTDK